MYVNPELYSGAPAEERDPNEMAVYAFLDRLGIPYLRCDHDYANTMEDCKAVEAVLGVPVCKNLLLTNRKQTDFYLLMMPGDKPFKTKDVTAQLDCARLSFASPEQMKALLGAAPGSASAFELMHDGEGGQGAPGHRPGAAGRRVYQRTPLLLHLHHPAETDGFSGEIPARRGPHPHRGGPALA